ncbi:hypothetical protein [Streptomyces sp. URMC 123]|uniref:hypothetical protein n=1 Tax=Streptomyces sp. URMC 123 TaxID=3423403 RepID=UPI003F194F6C
MGGRNFGDVGGEDLSLKAETLSAFKGRIDKIIADLEKSPAAKSKIDGQKVSRHSYGKGFSAAEDLGGLYDKVHAELQTLSQTFGEQLEALGIAVQISDRGYGNIDADQEARFRAIQKRAAEVYERQRTGGKADTGGTGGTDTADANTGKGDTGGAGTGNAYS